MDIANMSQHDMRKHNSPADQATTVKKYTCTMHPRVV